MPIEIEPPEVIEPAVVVEGSALLHDDPGGGATGEGSSPAKSSVPARVSECRGAGTRGVRMSSELADGGRSSRTSLGGGGGTASFSSKGGSIQQPGSSFISAHECD